MTKEEKFAEIYSQYHDNIYFFILSRISNTHVAEDLTNDVFVAAYRNFESYDSNISFISTWLYAIASNRLKNFYKSRVRIEQRLKSIEEVSEKNLLQII